MEWTSPGDLRIGLSISRWEVGCNEKNNLTINHTACHPAGNCSARPRRLHSQKDLFAQKETEGYQLSNYPLLTHSPTSGNIKIHFLRLTSKRTLAKSALFAAKSTAINPSRNIIAMPLSFFLIERTKSLWPDFYAILPSGPFPCCLFN